MITEVKQDELVLARFIPAFAAFQEGVQFFSASGDSVQVGLWNYPAGKNLAAHIHHEVLREVSWTQEAIVVRKGRLRVKVYDTNERHVADLEAGLGDIVILLRGGHGYEILEDDTQIIEFKNGPYLGAARDAYKIATS